MLKKIAVALFIALACTLVAFTQEPAASPAETPESKPSPELEKKALKLLESVATEGRALKLAENRVYVAAITADMFWTRDEKRARNLFRDAANDLLAMMNEGKNNNNSGAVMIVGGDFSGFSQVRNQFLQTVARRDPELALDLMRSTRPPKGDGGILDSFFNQERQLEQSLAIAVIAKDPKKALQIARESLAQGVSMSTINFLNKLRDKDKDAAKEFAGDIITKLKTENFTRNFEATFAAQALFRQLAAPNLRDGFSGSEQPAPKPLVLDEKQLQELAELVVNAALNPSPLNPTGALQLKPLLPALEKILPERAAQLKLKIAETEKALPPEMRRLMNAALNAQSGEQAPETAFEPAKDVPPQLTTALRSQAVSKLVNEGKYDQARQLINEKTEGPERENLLKLLEKARADKAIRDGQFDDAKKIATQTAGAGERAALFAKVAQAAFAKKDKELANKALEEALAAAPRFPESYDDMRNVAEVARVCATIAPEKAFDLLEPTMEVLNEILNASAVLEKYGRRGNTFRDGELRFSRAFGNLGAITQYGPEIGLLANANFDRTQTLVGRFRRDDARLLARLVLAQGILTGKFGLSSERGPFDFGDSSEFFIG